MELEENFNLRSIQILNTIQMIDKTPINIDFEDRFIHDITGIENAKSEVDYAEKLIIKLQAYQDGLQKLIDHRKNRKRVDDNIFIKLAHIYVMKDIKSGFHKIGRSINPKYRERTLQSEMPFIETIFISPLTYRCNESKFHRHFNDKRIRGEWFDLTPLDIDYIKSFNYSING